MKQEVDMENIPKYRNSASQNLSADRQIQKKIDETFARVTYNSYLKYERELMEKNTYFTKSKIPEVNIKDQEFQATKLKNSYKATTNNFCLGTNDRYCQKCPYMKNHCPHKNKKEDLKEKYSYPILTNSAYGWLPPIDKFRENHNINSVTKTFYDNSHL
jgi:hypothetical protein